MAQMKAEYHECYMKDHMDNNILMSVNKIEKKFKIKFKHGDVVNIGQYRDVYSYIVYEDEEDRLLIPNPDYSDSGHLTIPLKITEKLEDALSYYKGFHYSDIELSKNDITIKKIFKKESDILNKGKFSVTYYGSEELNISYNDMFKEFTLNTTQEEIENAFKTVSICVDIDNMSGIQLIMKNTGERIYKKPIIDWNLIVPSDKWTVTNLYENKGYRVMSANGTILDGVQLTGPVDEVDELTKRIDKMKLTNVA